MVMLCPPPFIHLPPFLAILSRLLLYSYRLPSRLCWPPIFTAFTHNTILEAIFKNINVSFDTVEVSW